MIEKQRKDLEYIISFLCASGYDPYEQLYGYLHTGDDTFITRNGNARSMIASLDKEQIWKYIAPHFKEIGNKKK